MKIYSDKLSLNYDSFFNFYIRYRESIKKEILNSGIEIYVNLSVDALRVLSKYNLIYTEFSSVINLKHLILGIPFYMDGFSNGVTVEFCYRYVNHNEIYI